MVREAVDQYRSASALVALGFERVTAEEAAAIRRRLRGQNVEVRVVRNRIHRRAFDELGFGDFGALIDGPTTVLAAEDVVEASQVAVGLVREFAREKKFRLMGGWAEGRTLALEDVRRLAAIPSRAALLAGLAGLAAGPLRKFVGMVQAPHASLARAIRAWNDGRERQGQPGEGNA
jgi:large subunit ribosomal protein L10